MISALRAVTAQAVEAYAKAPRTQWVLDWPGQVVLVVTAIYWTAQMASAIANAVPGGLHIAAKSNTSDLNAIVEKVRGQLSRLQRATLSALVVMDVHARDVAVQLAEENIEGSPGHFSWLAQLRMYWENTNAEDPAQRDVATRMINASAVYGYEYLGNSSRLVVTPLTDRCYRTLIGAIHMNLGGAPEGPAGTGKTETTKDLAKALARQCVVFNCSDTLDYLTMAKFFKVSCMVVCVVKQMSLDCGLRYA
jgi:dynein heavy chain, axonemal